MSAMKPDYFIARNGLPNILLARSRHVITHTKASKHDRISSYQPIHPQTESKSLPGMNQQAHVMQRDNVNNIKNRAIKESLRSSKATKDLINAQIVKSSHWNRRAQTLSKAEADNSDCNVNTKR